MATLAFMGVGAAIGSSVGGTVLGIGAATIGGIAGSMVGSVVDSMVIAPALMGKQEPISGTRLEDIRLQLAAEGTGIIQSFGPKNRVAGNVIWMSPWREVVDTVEYGGKGMGGATTEVDEYHYFCDVAIAVQAGQVVNITDMWADKEQIFHYSGSVSKQGSDISATVIKRRVAKCKAFSALGTWEVWLRLQSTSTDLSVFNVGVGHDISTSGFSNSGNNGNWQSCTYAWIVAEGGTVTQALDIYIGKYDDPGDVPVTDESAGATVTISQIFTSVDVGSYGSMAIYKGSETQAADGTIESHMGSGNVPGYRGIAYVVLSDLHLTHHGNRIPQFEFLAQRDATCSVGTAIGRILEQHGLIAAQYDVSALSALYIDGYAITGPQLGSTKIDPLMIGYDLVVQEGESKLTFFPRGQETTLAIAAADLGASDHNASAANPTCYLEPLDPADDPEEVIINYVDKDALYQRGSESEVRYDCPGKGVQSIELPLVFDGETAREIAARRLWSAAEEDTRATLYLPPRYMRAQPGDLLSFTYKGEDYIVRAETVTRGANFRIVIRAVVQEVATHTQSGVTDGSGALDAGLTVASEIILFAFESAPLRSDHLLAPGIYIAAAQVEPDKWQGAQVWISEDDSSFRLLRTVTHQATIGYANTVLAAPDNLGTWDLENTVDIIFTTGTPSSLTEAAVLRGENHFVVGNEIVGAVNATLVSGNKYRLSTLLRGRRDTMSEADDHETGEFCMLLDPSAVGFVPITLAHRGETKYLRAAPSVSGIDLSDGSSVKLKADAENMRAMGPCNIRATWIQDRLLIRWSRTTRSVERLFKDSGGHVPGDAVAHQYSTSAWYYKDRWQVEVFSDADLTTRVRGPVEKWGNPYWDYSNGMMTADGFDSNSTFYLTVTQYIENTGWGRRSEPIACKMYKMVQ